MNKLTFLLLSILTVTVTIPKASAADFPGIVQQSTDILSAKQTSLNPIPQLELLNAKGIAIVDITKGGFIVGGTGGFGIVLIKLDNPSLSAFQPMPASATPATDPQTGETLPFISTPSNPASSPVPPPLPDPAPVTTPSVSIPDSLIWSAPIPISFSGGSFGAQIGGSNTKAIVLLNSDHALHVFTHSGQLKWGATASGTSGPDSASVGKGGSLTDQDVKVYKQSDGVYGGATVGGAALSLNDKFLHEAYGSQTSVSDLIAGKVPMPEYAKPLIRLLQGMP